MRTRLSKADERMLWMVVLILVLMWLLGMVTAYTLSGLIHILLLAAVILLLVRLVQGRPPL